MGAIVNVGGQLLRKMYIFYTLPHLATSETSTWVRSWI